MEFRLHSRRSSIRLARTRVPLQIINADLSSTRGARVFILLLGDDRGNKNVIGHSWKTLCRTRRGDDRRANDDFARENREGENRR